MPWPWRIALRAACLGLATAVALPLARAQGTETPPTAERGRQLYTSYCARCHGLNMVAAGSAFFDLRTLGPDEQERFERAVKQGLRAMPAWGGILQPADIQALWLFVLAGR
jgi:mono/diheme cytochrome c family protein